MAWEVKLSQELDLNAASGSHWTKKWLLTALLAELKTKLIHVKGIRKETG